MSTRRKFLAGTAAGLTLGASNMSFNIITRKNPNAPVVGHADFTYRVHQDWGTQDPSKIPVKDCHEMVQDKDGRLLLLTNHPKNNIIIYDRSGKVTGKWTLDLPGAHGLTLADEGGEQVLFITDEKLGKVFKTDLNGKVLMELGYPEMIEDYGDGSSWHPTEVAVSPNGDFYVADGYGLNYIVQYDARGNYIRHWGGTGDEPGQFECCHGVTLDTRFGRGELLITSRTKNKFKRFSLDGKHLETIDLPGCWICRPVIRGDHLYFAVIVSKTWYGYDGMLAVLDKNNKVVSLPGGSSPEYKDGLLVAPDSDEITFMNPHDICVDQDENLYVPQWYSGRTYPVMLERV